MKKILIVDDCNNIIRALYRLLQPEPYDLHVASHPLDAIQMLEAETFDLILSDQRMPGMNGIELLTKAKELQPDCIRIAMSAFRDFESLIVAFNGGVLNHFIQKPWDNQTLKLLLQSFIGKSESAIASQTTRAHPIIMNSPNMKAVMAQVDLLRDQTTPVFIHGETGTGKEVIARAVHDVSATRKGPFIAVNASNLAPELLESQLFGHRKGAFTGAIKDQVGLLQQADGGTLFLDEITDLPPLIQSKMLRVLQEREFTPVGATAPQSFHCQIISASSTHLSEAVANNHFRADLMYRLDVFPICLPPLRERRADILALFEQFCGSRPDAECQKLLLDYHWPGNIRELQNTAAYVKASSHGGAITIHHLPSRLLENESGARGKRSSAALELQAYKSAGALGREDIANALLEHNNNKSAAARSLGISRMTLWRHIKRYELNS